MNEKSGLKISVIIPVYNAEEYLSQCLESVINQSLQDIELVCVNDGSTDSSLFILQQYAKFNKNIHIIDQPNLGVFAARNNAISVASGEFVCFMDSDDFYPNDTTLELLYSKAKEYNVLICGGSFSNINNGVVTTNFTGDNRKYTFDHESVWDYKDYQFDYGYHRFIYNREFLLENDILFPPYRRYQDPPFFVKAMSIARKFYAVKDVVYRYRVGFQVKPGDWPAGKLCDVLRGWLDNLNLSKEYNLADLHALTVRRIEGSYTFDSILKLVLEGNNESLNLLAKLNSAVDVNLLEQSGVDLNGEKFYVLKQFKSIINQYNNMFKEQQSKRLKTEGQLLNEKGQLKQEKSLNIIQKFTKKLLYNSRPKK